MWIPVFVAVYVIALWFFGARYPFFTLVSVFALAPIAALSSAAGGANLALADINAILALPVLALCSRNARFSASLGPLSLPIWLYLGLCIASAAVTFQGKEALLSVGQMMLYMVVVPLLFANLCSPRQCSKVFYYAIPVGLIWSIIGIATNFFFMGAQKNAFGSSIAVVFLVAYDLLLSNNQKSRANSLLKLGLAVSSLVMMSALILSVSRGAWLGTFIGMMLIIWLRRAYKQLLVQLMLFTPVVIFIWFSLPPQLRAYALSTDSQRQNIALRYQSVEIATKYFYAEPFLGSGVGLRKQYDATNLVLATLAESGLIGTTAFLLIFFCFFRLVWRLRRCVPVGDPCFSLLSIGAALMICKFAHGMVDHYWSRGSITMAWAGCGLVLCLHRYVVHRQAITNDSAPRRARRSSYAMLPRATAGRALVAVEVVSASEVKQEKSDFSILRNS